MFEKYLRRTSSNQTTMLGSVAAGTTKAAYDRNTEHAIRKLRRQGHVIYREGEDQYRLDVTRCAPGSWVERTLFKLLLRRMRMRVAGTDLAQAEPIGDSCLAIEEALR